MTRNMKEKTLKKNIYEKKRLKRKERNEKGKKY